MPFVVITTLYIKNSSYPFIEKKNLTTISLAINLFLRSKMWYEYFKLFFYVLATYKPIISKYLAIFWKIIYLRINKTKISIQSDYTTYLFFPSHELHKIVANNTISVKQNTPSSNQQPFCVYSQNSKMLLNKFLDHDESV